MTNTDFSPYEQPLSKEDRRERNVDSANTSKRRIDDSTFNKVRWPAFVYSWFVLGFVLLVLILFSVIAD